jgi:4-carboxymuconolactone decarboxylase
MAPPANETPVLDLLASMTADSIALSRSSLDPDNIMLVRIAALVAVDAPAASYLANLEAIAEVGIDAERVRGVLAAIAPIVGTARVASATGRIVDALDVAIEVAELDRPS